jgi:hypothetical protein
MEVIFALSLTTISAANATAEGSNIVMFGLVQL